MQLQLTPEHLGRIDAKLRMNEDRLLVELNTDKPQIAKILEKDQSLLIQALEKSGFSSEARLTIHIIERTAPQALSSPVSGMTGANSQYAFEQEGQKGQAEWGQTRDDSGFSSRDQEKSHNAPHEENSDKKFVERSNKSSRERHEYAPGSVHRLIV